MEDDVNFFEMEDNLNFFFKWKTTLNLFLKLIAALKTKNKKQKNNAT
jgi:hypothetical protein